MTKEVKWTKKADNSNITFSNEHEERELKAVEKIALNESLDPEANGLVEYTEKTFSNVCLVPLYDLHIGGEGTKIDRLKKIIEFIKNTPNAVCVLGGDILDNATLNGATNPHFSKVNPDRALDLAVKLLEPIKDKILCGIGGNHDGSAGARNRDSDMAQAKQLCKRLGVKYYPYNAILKIKLPLKNAKIRKQDMITYNIFMTHGSGSAGNKAGTIDIAFRKACNSCGFIGLVPDLILTGHFHADADGMYNLIVDKKDESGKIIGLIKKPVRIESLSTMQEANSFAVANSMNMTRSNMYAINLCWLKNPYYYEANKANEYEFLGQSTKFPVLKNSKNELTRVANEYQEAYRPQDDLEHVVRDLYKNSSIHDLVNMIEK